MNSLEIWFLQIITEFNYFILENDLWIYGEKYQKNNNGVSADSMSLEGGMVENMPLGFLEKCLVTSL